MGSEVKRICCIGAGYVGATTCAVLALKARNVRVTVVDTNQTRIDAWNSGHLPIYEPGLDDIVSLTRDGDIGRPPNLFFSTDVASAIRSAEVIFIAVNTPTKTSGVGVGQACDLAFVESAARQIVEISDSDKIVVEKSTVPCGTAERLRSIFTDLGKPGVHLEVLSNPEFLSEGTAVLDLLRPDRVLLGSQRTETGADAVQILSDIYELWVAPERIININVRTPSTVDLL